MAFDIKFTGFVEYVNINTAAFTRAIEINLQHLIREAANEFLKAAASRVRVRTGFAHGAFGALAKQLGVPLPSGIPGTPPRKGGEYYYSGGSKIRKTPSVGEQFATIDGLTNRQVSSEGNIFFTFNINIDYFRRNDVSGNAGYSPWNAYRDGIAAFQKYVNENLGDIVPNLKDYTQVIRSNI